MYEAFETSTDVSLDTLIAETDATISSGIDQNILISLANELLANEAREAQRLADLEAARLAGIEAQRLADLEAARLATIETQRLADLEAARLATIETQRLADLETARLALEKKKATIVAVLTKIISILKTRAITATEKTTILNFIRKFIII